MAYRENDEGLLIFQDSRLVAVMTKLGPDAAQHHGWWHLECGFEVAGMVQQTFPDLDTAYSHFDDVIARSDRIT